MFDALTAGTSAAIWIHEPPDGSSLNACAVTARVCAAVWTSTIGVSPVTVIVSATAPTFMSPFTCDVTPIDTSTPSRRMLLKPVSEKVTVYWPGGRLMMRYCPDPSVATARTFSISTGLAASTVTPGRTAPDASLTTPAIVPSSCAEVDAAMARNAATTQLALMNLFIGPTHLS